MDVFQDFPEMVIGIWAYSMKSKVWCIQEFWEICYKLCLVNMIVDDQNWRVVVIVFSSGSSSSSSSSNSSSSCNSIPNRIQQYNTVCMTNIANSRMIIDILMWFCGWPSQKPWAYQAGSLIRWGTGYMHQWHTKWSLDSSMKYINGLVQECKNSSASALELLQSCTKSSMSTFR